MSKMYQATSELHLQPLLIFGARFCHAQAIIIYYFKKFYVLNICPCPIIGKNLKTKLIILLNEGNFFAVPICGQLFCLPNSWICNNRYASFQNLACIFLFRTFEIVKQACTLGECLLMRWHARYIQVPRP